MSAEEVAKAFTGHYYQAFDSNADSLAGLFQAQSMMTFEGQQFMGPQAIIAKLKQVGQVQHQVKSMDFQPSTSPSALIIFVTGSIKIGGDNPLHFCEFFQLVSTGPNQYYVHNSVMRLNYGL
mmetsp:Transcript_13873/g.33560  ORF Transcript_13873/g.33560 Transcript_13873/m.33560 type:complete len:122 (+) Transcript_13873:1016-1381(+)|eukprot:CAMPEP_0113602108 /NCGR_PEP_ID=MMETSP0017_2-20120614/579_1 /TAXON_ID=2856 /ORGANISM="Cylindrotheca closterium" /LENGTH=121 /DNA_ID=CAMNT_0000510431 /DNA_START=147 /DNA_END=512 /DNA_ORIENTATION=- /assembly_acc=CAM_ASM_000147